MAEYNEPSNPRIDENQSSTPPLPLKIKYLIGILSVSTVGLLASTIALAKVQVCGAVCVCCSKSLRCLLNLIYAMC
jgi:hypothetical protein